MLNMVKVEGRKKSNYVQDELVQLCAHLKLSSDGTTAG